MPQTLAEQLDSLTAQCDRQREILMLVVHNVEILTKAISLLEQAFRQYVAAKVAEEMHRHD
jgi:hypothetical protein